MSQIIRSRLSKALDPIIESFVQCIDDDKHLAKFDVKGSLAHIKMLAEQRLVGKNEAKQIADGLKKIQKAITSNSFAMDSSLEDVHMNIEHALKTIIGEDADHLHTARSRNDQVALDITLYICDASKVISGLIKNTCVNIAHCGLNNIGAVMPGYTHLQKAQPVLFSHILASYITALKRDLNKFENIPDQAVSPLGAGALTGSSLDISPKLSAKNCGLKKAFENSIDAVTNRDLTCDFIYVCALTLTHLSQIAETLIIWSSFEYGFIELSDNICTSSSLMPQKKNPDALELIRSKAPIITGNLTAALGILKALPSGYNRDLQDIKPLLINTFELTKSSLNIVSITFKELKANGKRMREACDTTIFATDLVEKMVRSGTPFREAYTKVAGSIKDNTYTRLAKKYKVTFDPGQSVAAKKSHGSTSPKLVKKYLEAVISDYGAKR